MRLALALHGFNPANPAAAAYVELARAAERSGYESVWAPEIRATDPFALLAWIGSQTQTIGLGCAVAQVAARSAVSAAVAGITLDGLYGGRFRLGLGVSGPQYAEGWHGLRFARPVSYLREYVTVVRLALSGQPISYAGKEIVLPPAGATPGINPLPMPTAPGKIPIYLAGMGRNSITLAGELADGWIGIHCPPSYIASVRGWLAEGAARSGRSLADFTTAVTVLTAVEEDQDLARDLVRPVLALYLGGMGTPTTNFYYAFATRLGYEAPAAAVRAAYLSGDIDEAIDSVSDEMLDAMTICGDEDHVAGRLAAYRDAGVDMLIISPAAPGRRAELEMIELLGGLAGASGA
jgi:F420-dependent oxidoreductase-like protein